MTKQDVKKIVKEVIKEDVNPRFEAVDTRFDKVESDMVEFKNDIISSFHTAMDTMKEHVSSEMKVFKDYIDGKDEKTNRRVDELESKQKTCWDLVTHHDRLLEKK